MKADNEPEISLPVYFKSVKKRKYVLRKNKTNKGPKKKKEKKLHSGRAEPPTSDVEGLPIIYCGTTTNIKDLIC